MAVWATEFTKERVATWPYVVRAALFLCSPTIALQSSASHVGAWAKQIVMHVLDLGKEGELSKHSPIMIKKVQIYSFYFVKYTIKAELPKECGPEPYHALNSNGMPKCPFPSAIMMTKQDLI